MAEGQLSKFGIIRVTGGTTNMMESGLRLIVTGAEVLGAHDGAVCGAEAAAMVKEEPRDADMQASRGSLLFIPPLFLAVGQ